MNDYSSGILNHEFAEENLEDVRTYMEKLLRGEPYSPSELEKYSFSLMKQKQRIRYCFESLEHTRVYMRHFRSNKWYREAGIVQGNYINYHYTKYAITVVTIVDVCLILTNDTFRLGNPERLCSLENITKNSWVTSSKVDKSLNKLSKIVEPWREPRNLFIHRGERLWRDRLIALEELELSQEKGKLKHNIPPQKVKSLYQSELSEIFRKFDQVETPLFDAVIELLSKLLPVYISWRKKLQTPPMGERD
jgi:hypothetical protein